MKLIMNLSRLAMAITFAASLGCQTAAQKNVDTKVANESGTYTEKDMSKKVKDIFSNNEKLSQKQRTDLLVLHSKTTAEVQKIRFEMGKLKGVFLKNLIANETNDSELNIVKKKLVKLNDQKMDVMFDSMSSAKKILGKEIDDEMIMPFLFDHPVSDRL